MSRPTYIQLEALADFLVQNTGIAKGLLRTAHAKFDTKRKWDEVSRSLNALGGAQKDGRGWAKYWADKKCSLKKICAQNATSLKATGGGGPVEKVPLLTPIDQRLVAVMGGPQFAIGDYQLAIDPFPSPNIAPDTRDTISSQRTDAMDSQNGEILLAPNSETQAADSVAVHNIPNSQSRERSPNRERNERQRYRSRNTSSANVREDRHLFAEIERKRVEAEHITAEALRESVDNMSSIAAAINNLAAAITDAARTIARAISASVN